MGVLHKLTSVSVLNSKRTTGNIQNSKEKVLIEKRIVK
jgi:hypothetical protein